MPHIPEPPLHDDDTSPSRILHPEDTDGHRIAPDVAVGGTWRKYVAWISLLGAALFTLASVAVLLMPTDSSAPAPQIDIVQATITDLPNIASDVPIIEAMTTQPTQVMTSAPVANQALPPIVSADQLIGIEQAFNTVESSFERVAYNPFTIVKTDRPRSEFINYTVVRGDTMDDIANRYGIDPESIAWCNDRRVVVLLIPGDTLRIPPTNGACHQVFGSRQETVTKIAEQYQIDNPYTIIDSETNREQLPSSITPTDILLGGTYLFIPGGTGEVITWNVAAQEVDESGSVIGISFARGESGSCGNITPSGGAAWGNPLPNGRWVRGFYAGHSGLDLSAGTGTPIYAANSGYVLFSGYSNWGYGNAVVIEHGNTYSTLYGHMSQRNVSCGQYVTVGQVIGLVGSTGDSTGPHLHFEIRVNGQAVNPSGTPGIGW